MSTINYPELWRGKIDSDDARWARRWSQQVIDFSTFVAAENGFNNEHVATGLLGFSCDLGVAENGGRVGAAQGPNAIRRQLANLAWHEDSRGSVADFGNVVPEEKSDLRVNSVAVAQTLLADRVAEVLPAFVERNGRLLVMGGGHETAFGSFCGLQRTLPEGTQIGIVNLDAHFDLRPDTQGASSGTPFYQVRERVGEDCFHYLCLGVAEEANTQALFRRADSWGVKYLLDREMGEQNLAEVEHLLEQFSQRVDVLYLTLDLDVLPHYQAPGVSAPASRGVSLTVIESVIAKVISLSQTMKYVLPLVEITELNPLYDTQSVTARTAAVLATKMLRPT